MHVTNQGHHQPGREVVVRSTRPLGLRGSEAEPRRRSGQVDHGEAGRRHAGLGRGRAARHGRGPVPPRLAAARGRLLAAGQRAELLDLLLEAVQLRLLAVDVAAGVVDELLVLLLVVAVGAADLPLNLQNLDMTIITRM